MTHAAWVVEPGAGDAVWIGSFGTIYKVPGEETENAVAVVEHVLGAGALGAPLHRHSREDETSYVLEGELTVQVGSAVRTLTAGAAIVKPRGVFHTFWNLGHVPVRFLEIISPGGFDRYFRELSGIVSAEAPPDLAAIGRLGARYGVEFDFDSIPKLIEDHGLRLG